MNETQKGWQGLGTPAGPQIGWAAPQPSSGPVPVPPPQPAPVASPPMHSRSRPRLAAVLAAAVLAGGASGAGVVVVALDRGAPTAGPTIVQERAPASGSASAGSTEAAASQALPSVVQVRASRGGGSGVVMDGEGHVLTNLYVD